ncbi:trigger factor [Lachnospiraceae bacterium]|nr:trigger factor [Lachnospiraceae bacterium]
MKSKVLSFAEYDQVDISMYKQIFTLDEKAYKKEMDFIKNKNSTWEEAGEVTDGALIVCDMESTDPFFSRENLKIMVGQGFFHKKLEAMCVGLKKGTAGVLDVDGEKVTVTVRSIQQKKIPVITDEMIEALGIEGVSNVEQYEARLIREQKKKIAENEGYEAVQYVMDKVFEASMFDLKKADWKEMTDHEIKRLKAISREQGLNLETMTPEDFEGKMPFSSYHELFASVQNDSWDRLCGYLLGREYAEKDGVGYTMEQYRDDMEEYVKFWHETKENAEKINTYEYSEIMFYVNYYYNKVKEYVTENFFKEEK